MRELTDDAFEDWMAEHPGPVVVEFWAPWCGPCRQLEPVLKELAAHFAGKVAFARVNTDECPTTCTHFDVVSIPTVLIFLGHAPLQRLVGMRPRAALADRLYRLTER